VSDEPDLAPPPAPSAAFRGDLRRRLDDDAPAPPRPARLWLWIGLAAVLGALLLLIAAASI